MKEYPNGIIVKIFHWGSRDHVADGDDAYFGIYGVITSEKDISELLKTMFDEVEQDNEKPSLYMVKKRKMFLGEDQFKDLLKRLDSSISQY